MVGTVDVLLGNLEDAVKADNKEAARDGLVRSRRRPTSARPSCGPGSTPSTAVGRSTT
jgi:malyl-CoA/(S)-citramalyl-CoA lyase